MATPDAGQRDDGGSETAVTPIWSIGSADGILCLFLKQEPELEPLVCVRPFVRSGIMLPVCGNNIVLASRGNTGGLSTIPNQRRDQALRRIEESHQRFLRSRMFQRFSSTLERIGKTDEAARALKEKGVLLSATIEESRSK